ncbi:EAL domain-containing protein [Pedococcus sp. KACC 23699]|uniref:EAL domain-containing protein n=1 Tax=Pedococcus sp. KACC 23699 TaxID=3149228 RepID=A0AAU7JNX2_9MICO
MNARELARTARHLARSATGARPRPAEALAFGLLVVGALAATLLPASRMGTGAFEALAAMVVGLGLAGMSVRRRQRSWVDPLGPLLVMVGVILLRGALGGAVSGVGPLVAVPLVWLALFGTLGDLAVAAVVAGVVFVGPGLVAHLTAAPGQAVVVEWRPAVLWSAVALLAAPVIQGVIRGLTAQNRAERRAAAQLRAIMGGATLTSIISTDADGVITNFNVGAEDMLKYDADEALGRKVHELIHDAAELAHAAGQLGVEPGVEVFATLAENHMPSREWTYVRKDGRRISVRLAVTELRSEDGEVTGYLGVAVDTTAAVEMRRELKEAQALWRLSMDHLPDTAVLVLDRTLEVSLSTGGGARRQGLAQAAGRDVSESFTPKSFALLKPLIDGALEGRDGVVELTAPESGAEHEVWVSPLPGTSTTSGAALIMARDVSRDRERERLLRTSHDRIQRLFVDAPHGIAVLGRDGYVRQVNPSLCLLLGRGEEELVGSPLAALGAGDDDRIPTLLACTTREAGARTDWSVTTPVGAEVHLNLSSTVLAGGGAPEEDELLVNVADVSERHAYEQQLAHLADHDTLTGLANRRRFAVELDRHLDFCRRYGARGALLLIDLDHFKEVNDTLGHAAGDTLLMSLAEVLTQSVRSTDIVARLGGDEFAVLLLETDLAGTELVAEHLVAAVRAHHTALGAAADAVTASVGAVLIGGGDGLRGAEELLTSADSLMYQAKQGGRDGWAVLGADATVGVPMGSALGWSQRIETAIAEDEFSLHLQPIWDIGLGRVTGAEVLLRHGPDAVPPREYLAQAEKSGLVLAIDRWVLERAIPLLQRFQGVRPDFELSVNLSGRSVGDSQIEEVVQAALLRSGADGTGLVLEVTETAVVPDLAKARAFAERLGEEGCRFALDDFGAGFGSFSYLKHLPFAYVKIDGEFVADCDVDPTDRAIVASIVQVAHELGKRTVAEYVGSAQVLDVLALEGVDLAQGHHLGHPIPAEEFLALLAADGFVAPEGVDVAVA